MLRSSAIFRSIYPGPVWQHTFVSPSAFSRRAVVSNWRKYVHEVLVNRLGGLSLPRKSVVRLTDRPDMTLDVYRGRKTTIQQQQFTQVYFEIFRNPPFNSRTYGMKSSVNIFRSIYQSCLEIFRNLPFKFPEVLFEIFRNPPSKLL